MKLEEKIAFLRKKNGWSQEELAFRLDVSRQAVSKWEMGASLPDLDNVLKMSELFGCSTDYLLKDDVGEQANQTDQRAEEKVAASPDATPAQQKPKKGVWEYVEDLFWLIILLVYLVCSFWTGAWFITWIIFPISGAVFALIECILKIIQANKARKNEKEK